MTQREEDPDGEKDRARGTSTPSKKSKDKAAKKKVAASKKKVKAEKKPKKGAAASTGAKDVEGKSAPVVRSIVSPVARPAVLSRHWNSMHRREARGYSFGELGAAGMSFVIAKSLRVPVDLRRRSVIQDNVDTLKEWYKPVERPKVAAAKPKRLKKARRAKKVKKIKRVTRAKKVKKTKKVKKPKKSSKKKR